MSVQSIPLSVANGGRGISASPSHISLTGNGSTKAFTVSGMDNNVKVKVRVNGLLQKLSTDYSRSGSTLTFVVAPLATDWLDVTLNALDGF
jgi:hypothetical protein